MGRILLILVLVVVGVLLIDRFLLRAESRGWIYWRRRRSGSGAAAFEAMNEILVTGAPRFVEEEEAQSSLAVEVEEGAPPSPEGRREDSPQETRE
ncbi:hypothetical protein [Actinomyces mediterranea]|uniref:hypothetical protein n=1 Tax=Actinomyces mediterranea TaxID=1871028 RepID=UPI0009707521|nr:hypothetical protein [Actinomyces mediterranea]